jgi:hypothetical protein
MRYNGRQLWSTLGFAASAYLLISLGWWYFGADIKDAIFVHDSPALLAQERATLRAAILRAAYSDELFGQSTSLAKSRILVESISGKTASVIVPAAIPDGDYSLGEEWLKVYNAFHPAHKRDQVFVRFRWPGGNLDQRCCTPDI